MSAPNGKSRERTLMAENTLLALALSVQDAHDRLISAVETLPEEARFLVSEVEKRLKVLIAQLREREQQLDGLHEALADRMNNLLMAIKTASDILRGEDGEDMATVRERLDGTVENGRQSVKKLRDALGHLR
jgi:hypothetical protein